MKRALLVLVVLLAVAPAVGQPLADTTTTAELDVTQPHYINSSVRTDTSGNTTTYIAAGEVLYFGPENFNESNVIDYGIRETAGELTYDQGVGAYRLDTQGTNGTYHLYWIAERTRTVAVNNTTTETTTRTRYEAAVEVSRTDMKHVEDGTIAQYRAAAANWSEWQSTICDITGKPCDIQTETQQAVNQMKLIHNPFNIFTGGLTTALIILLTTPGGLLLLFSDKIREWLTSRKERSELNERVSLDSDRASIEDRIDEDEYRKRAQTAARQDIGEVAPPHVAERLREQYGDTLYEVHAGLVGDISDVRVAHDRLQAMALADWRATFDGDVMRVRPPADDPTDDAPGVPIRDLPRDDDAADSLYDYLGMLVVDDAFLGFDLPGADIERDKLETATDLPATMDELADAYEDIAFAFDSDDDWASCFVDLVEDIEQRPLIDPDGRPNTVRDRLSALFQLERTLVDDQRLPVSVTMRERLKAALNHHDPWDDARERMQQSQEGAS